ncbi:hypothetical protein BKA61DRAFT_576135 [Leptodontidium sp. MPI-SDFR-AT-0119]|nr:hypothetical protein BKA61DRAFT_576135 [Leptodontidium sp. MPI-SDFR-AT-0119]
MADASVRAQCSKRKETTRASTPVQEQSVEIVIISDDETDDENEVVEEVVSEVENEVVNKEKHKDENMGENEEESGDEMAMSAEYEATFEPGNWRFSNLLDYRRTFRWENDKEYTTPIPEVHPIASSLTDSIPNLPGLEFARSFTDWILPAAKDTKLVIHAGYVKPEMEIQDFKYYNVDEAERKVLERKRNYKQMLKFLDQF